MGLARSRPSPSSWRRECSRERDITPVQIRRPEVPSSCRLPSRLRAANPARQPPLCRWFLEELPQALASPSRQPQRLLREELVKLVSAAGCWLKGGCCSGVALAWVWL